jgi:hypothetical protein
MVQGGAGGGDCPDPPLIMLEACESHDLLSITFHTAVHAPCS